MKRAKNACGQSKDSERNLAQAYDSTLEGWVKVVELSDKSTEDHTRRGTMLHDIGKIVAIMNTDVVTAICAA